VNDLIKKKYPLGFPWPTQDPFIFCVHHLDRFPKGNTEMGPDTSLSGRNLGNDFTGKDGWSMYHGKEIPGFPYHPHRGFETVTIANLGYCDHSDSLGAAGRFGNGDVQWMTAGKGVQHSEMFPLLSTTEENPLELFQIWLNLPAVRKLVPPHFSMLWHEDIPVVETNGTRVKVVAGTFAGHPAPAPAPNSWAADPGNEVAIWHIEMAPGTQLVLPPTIGNVNRTLYGYSGEQFEIGQEKIPVGHGVDLVSTKETSLLNGGAQAHFLLLQGKPIQEPIARYGPFVMNTPKELEQAMQEYRDTEFGGWPWPRPDYVHPRGKGRFAKFPDGTLIEK
jgi:hypothetical protein